MIIKISEASKQLVSETLQNRPSKPALLLEVENLIKKRDLSRYIGNKSM